MPRMDRQLQPAFVADMANVWARVDHARVTKLSMCHESDWRGVYVWIRAERAGHADLCGPASLPVAQQMAQDCEGRICWLTRLANSCSPQRIRLDEKVMPYESALQHRHKST